MERISKSALVRVILIVASLLYGILHHFRRIPEGFNEGFTILLLLLVLELAIELIIESRNANASNEPRSHLLRRTINDRVLAAMKEELSNIIVREEEGFRVEHKTLALSSYDTFWRFLVEEQRRRASPLHLKIIHSCDFEIWVDHPLTKNLMERHKEFTTGKADQHGGTVERILCGSGKRPDPKIYAAAENMRDAGVKVFYHDMNEEAGITHSYAWDFLTVVDSNLSVIWGSFTQRAHGVIGEATYLNSSQYRKQDLNRLWQDIRAHSVDFPFIPAQLDGQRGDPSLPAAPAPLAQDDSKP